MADTTLDAVSLPPARAIEFLRQKTNRPTEHWTDVWQDAHSSAFAVAGAASEALVQDFRVAVAKALEQGTTLAEFRRDFDDIVARNGWTYNGTPAWRSQIIYETNLSTAYSAGRYAEMTEPAALRAFPYWQYVRTGSLIPRKEHLAWAGTVLRADDPWWSTHYPPNGWKCRCSVRPVSARGLGRMGKAEPDPAPAVNLRPWRNPRTGEVLQVPDGIDPGFGYNPGQAWKRDVPASGVVPPAPGLPPPAPAPPPSLPEFLRAPRAEATAGSLPAPIAAELGAAGTEVKLSAETFAKQMFRHSDLTPADYLRLPELLDAPALVLRQSERRLVLLRRFEGDPLAAFVKVTEAGDELFLVSFRRARLKDFRRMMKLYEVVAGEAATLEEGGAPKGPPSNPS